MARSSRSSMATGTTPTGHGLWLRDLSGHGKLCLMQRDPANGLLPRPQVHVGTLDRSDAERSGLGSIACEPQGAIAIGDACTFLPAAQLGYDNCVGGGVCVAGICEQICDNNSAVSGCDASQVCVNHDGLFANEGATTTPAGVCETTCDPLADNDFDGAGSAHVKTGTVCGPDPTVGCYGRPSTTGSVFTCMPEAPGSEHYTSGASLPASRAPSTVVRLATWRRPPSMRAAR